MNSIKQETETSNNYNERNQVLNIYDNTNNNKPILDQYGFDSGLSDDMYIGSKIQGQFNKETLGTGYK